MESFPCGVQVLRQEPVWAPAAFNIDILSMAEIHGRDLILIAG